jgi:hypothetical protein
MVPENNYWTALKEKFWNGNTSLEEDRQLKTHYRNEAAGRELEPDEQYFVLLALEEEELLDERFDEETLKKINLKSRSLISIWYIRVAAVILLALTIGLFQYFGNKPGVGDTITVTPTKLQDDPELAKAFEQTKQALLLVSEKLNKGQQQTMLLSKFDHAQQHVKYTIEQ